MFNVSAPRLNLDSPPSSSPHKHQKQFKQGNGENTAPSHFYIFQEAIIFSIKEFSPSHQQIYPNPHTESKTLL